MAELFSTGSSLHMRGTGRGAQVGGRTIQVSEILTGNHRSYHSIWGCNFSRTNQSMMFISGSSISISACQVFEHLHQPFIAMQQIHRLLAPGGFLWLRISRFSGPYGPGSPWFFCWKIPELNGGVHFGGYPNRWMVYFMEKWKKNY